MQMFAVIATFDDMMSVICWPKVLWGTQMDILGDSGTLGPQWALTTWRGNGPCEPGLVQRGDTHRTPYSPTLHLDTLVKAPAFPIICSVLLFLPFFVATISAGPFSQLVY